MKTPAPITSPAQCRASANQGSNSHAGPGPLPQHCSVNEHEPFFDAFPGEMLELREQIKRIAPQDATVLLTGETGTGKTRLARLIHELSPRRAEPFLVIDCGAISANLIESEMFGHVKGAFTGADRDRPGKLAAAGRGTLLLDEIHSLPLSLQAKLLRALDDRVFEAVGSERGQPLRARLIAASNAPLYGEVAAGRFRLDLFFRINVVGVYLPPLRNRTGAIAPLVYRFLTELAARNRPDVRGVTTEVLRALQDYRWPGNVRELRNVIERAIAWCAGPDVQMVDLPEAVRMAAAGKEVAVAPDHVSAQVAILPSNQTLEKVQCQQPVRHRRNDS
jgi:two-component system, NtrC family, response regulator HydG